MWKSGPPARVRPPLRQGQLPRATAGKPPWTCTSDARGAPEPAPQPAHHEGDSHAGRAEAEQRIRTSFDAAERAQSRCRKEQGSSGARAEQESKGGQCPADEDAKMASRRGRRSIHGRGRTGRAVRCKEVRAVVCGCCEPRGRHSARSVGRRYLAESMLAREPCRAATSWCVSDARFASSATVWPSDTPKRCVAASS